MNTTLLVVDDHEAFRSFVSRMLDGDDFHVTGVAPDGESAIEVAGRLHPDVVLLDVNLPGIDGFEVAERLAASIPAPRVVLTSTREAREYGVRLATSPAVGFVAKHELSVDSLRRAVNTASRPGGRGLGSGTGDGASD